jgi:hypothetical protein
MCFLLRLAAVWEVRKDGWQGQLRTSRDVSRIAECGRVSRTCDFVRRTTFTGRDHYKKLHDAIVDLSAARLDDKDIFFSNTREDLHTGFALKQSQTPLQLELFAILTFANWVSSTFAGAIPKFVHI